MGIQRNVYEFILRVEKSLRDELNEDEFNILVSLIDRLAKKIAD
ncbi:hypothetical protein FHU26_004896 [Clostridium beijerinckii]|nr:hypothetical protein [Clostridium beijerinckii]